MVVVTAGLGWQQEISRRRRHSSFFPVCTRLVLRATLGAADRCWCLRVLLLLLRLIPLKVVVVVVVLLVVVFED